MGADDVWRRVKAAQSRAYRAGRRRGIPEGFRHAARRQSVSADAVYPIQAERMLRQAADRRLFDYRPGAGMSLASAFYETAGETFRVLDENGVNVDAIRGKRLGPMHWVFARETADGGEDYAIVHEADTFDILAVPERDWVPVRYDRNGRPTRGRKVWGGLKPCQP